MQNETSAWNRLSHSPNQWDEIDPHDTDEDIRYYLDDLKAQVDERGSTSRCQIHWGLMGLGGKMHYSLGK